MKAKHQLSAALGVFIGLIILTEIIRAENPEVTNGPETTVQIDFEIPEKNYRYSPDTNEILKTFFPEGKMANERMIGWKPDLEEKLSMSISEDGWCYTILDTILQVDIYEETELYVFKTESYLKDLKTRNEKYPTDYSFALVKANGNYIKSILNFAKQPFQFNYMPVPTEMTIIPLGEKKKALKMVAKNKFDPQESYETLLIDTESLHPLLNFISYRSNEKVIDDPFQINNGLTKKEVEFSTQSGTGGNYDIILNQRETSFDASSEKVITHYTTKVYRWNENAELELCYE